MVILCCIDSLHTIVLPFITTRMLLDRGMTLLVGFRIASKLDFIQLRSIAERVSEALQQRAWDFNQISLRLGH